MFITSPSRLHGPVPGVWESSWCPSFLAPVSKSWSSSRPQVAVCPLDRAALSFPSAPRSLCLPNSQRTLQRVWCQATVLRLSDVCGVPSAGIGLAQTKKLPSPVIPSWSWWG